MVHPLKGKAHSTSRDKFKSITGVAGGGHAHQGSSHMKKPGAHGVHRHWDGHGKTHILEGRAHGGRSRARADKYARGGSTPTNPIPGSGWNDDYEDTPGGPWGNEHSVAKTYKGDPSNRKRGTYTPPQTQDWGDHPAHGRKRGGAKRARGGRAEGGKKERERLDIDVSRPESQRKHPTVSKPEMLHSDEYAKMAGRGDPEYRSGWSKQDLEGTLYGKRGGRFARGGRTKGGAPENVTINITQPPPQDQKPPMPPPQPPAPPAGGAPPPMPPGGGPGGPGGPGGAMGGLGKGLGFAKGGRVGKHGRAGAGGRPEGGKAGSGHGKGRSIGDSNYDLSHWRKYANTDRQKVASSRAGLTQAHTQGIDKVQKRASGGRLHPTGGAMSGVGRLEQYEFQKRHRK